MIAERSPTLEKAASRLLELSEDEHTRHRLESYRRYEMDNRVLLKEAREEGMAKGREEGKAEGLEKGMEKGMEKGLEKGMKKGMEKGMAKERERVISLIEKGVPLDEIKKLLSEQ